MSGVWEGSVSREGEDGALSDLRGRLVGAKILMMRAVWPQRAEWGLGRVVV